MRKYYKLIGVTSLIVGVSYVAPLLIIPVWQAIVDKEVEEEVENAKFGVSLLTVSALAFSLGYNDD